MAELQVIPLTYPEGGEGPGCVDVEQWRLYKNPYRYLGQICQFGAKKNQNWNPFKNKIPRFLTPLTVQIISLFVCC